MHSTRSGGHKASFHPEDDSEGLGGCTDGLSKCGLAVLRNWGPCSVLPWLLCFSMAFGKSGAAHTQLILQSPEAGAPLWPLGSFEYTAAILWAASVWVCRIVSVPDRPGGAVLPDPE